MKSSKDNVNPNKKKFICPECNSKYIRTNMDGQHICRSCGNGWYDKKKKK